MRINPWTDERKASLKAWWLEEKRTSTEIVELFAKEGFHTTRNAVIGAVHRSGWWEGMSRTKRPPKPRAPKKATRDKEKRSAIPEPPPPPPVKLRTPPEQPLPEAPPGQPLYLSVVQIGHDQCRYWYGESWGQAGRKNQTGYCGQAVSPDNRSWCDAHLKLVYARTPPQGRQSIPVKF